MLIVNGIPKYAVRFMHAIYVKLTNFLKSYQVRIWLFLHIFISESDL